MRSVISKKGNNYTVMFGPDICDPILTERTLKYFEQLMEIDAVVYGGEEKGEDCVYIGDVQGYINRFGYVDDGKQSKLDPKAGVVDNMVAVLKDDKIVGYISYLTLGDELYEEMLHPDINAYLNDPERRDDGIKGTQLKQWTKDGENNLFVLSIAIDPKYWGSDVIQVLTDGFRDELINKKNQGYDITSISMDTVSEHGEKFAKMLRCDIAKDNGEQLILPAPESDKSGHPVTVRLCEGKNIDLLLTEGFDFSYKEN